MQQRIALPSECRTTKELFGPVEGSKLNVDLNTLGDEFLVYADGYKLAADAVVRNLCMSEKQFLVFPVCYLYRHYLELMIKGLTRLAKAILKKREVPYSPGHPLHTLWKECRHLLEEAMPQYSKDGFDDVAKCIEAFAFDFEGEFFRYPEDLEYRPWPQPVERINLQKMHETVSAAAEHLDSYYLEMNSQLEHRAEIDSCMEDY